MFFFMVRVDICFVRNRLSVFLSQSRRRRTRKFHRDCNESVTTCSDFIVLFCLNEARSSQVIVNYKCRLVSDIKHTLSAFTSQNHN
jgi:hypothetical protein